ncbi:eukaryotic translation initiation factor [Nesidiocoris tenuis]|uniref:eIF-4F 25 kDa subunit n=1 Tax=Nesidiocoris tenuis TaxID=355587 RepID=A0ABN7AMB1_9HEMI|nr:eukaryotic translation initiation factor [Nesidiocoris tenuis]
MPDNTAEEEIENRADNIIDIHIKHPLNNTWVLWYYENDRRNDWTKNLKEITSVSTVEDFWSVYNHVKCASELKHGCDYSFFKKDIRPMWEDDANKNGGRWLVSLEKRQRESDLDNCWLEIMLCLIGESFGDYSDEVNGATVNVRQKADKIGLWTADGSKAKGESIMAIGRKMKERLGLDRSKNTAIHYQLHKDTQVKAGSLAKNTYSL